MVFCLMKSERSDFSKISILGTIYLFCLYFNVKFLPVGVSLSYIINIIIFCFFVFFRRSVLVFLIKSKSLLIPFLTLCCFFILSIIWPVAHKTFDFGLSAAFLGLINLYIGTYIFFVLFLFGRDFRAIFKYFFYISIVQAFVILFMLFLPCFRDIIFEYFTNARHVMERSGFRGFGLAGELVYALSVGLSFGLIYGLYFQFNDRFSWLRFLGIVVIAFSILFVARSAFVAIPFIFLLFFASLFNGSNIRIRVFFRGLMLLSLSSFLIFILILYLKYNYYGVYEFLYRWSFELFVNLFDKGELSSDSTDHLMTMFFVPEFSTIMFGDARFSDGAGGYYMNTDSGYLRYLLYFGVFPSILLVLFFFAIFLSSLKSFKVLPPKIVFISLFLISLIMNIKGTFITTSYFSVTIFLFYFYANQRSMGSFKDYDLHGAFSGGRDGVPVQQGPMPQPSQE